VKKYTVNNEAALAWAVWVKAQDTPAAAFLTLATTLMEADCFVAPVTAYPTLSLQ
jgi:hypothetical protein